MDYLDPLKNRRDKRLLIIGYFLISVMITMTTLILFYVTEGFGVNGNGNVIQNGLMFFSSQPNPASIYINNKLISSQTNTSFLLPSGTYNVRIKKTGYISWQRSVIVNGGTVEHFDYPFLFPSKLITNNLMSIDNLPQFDTQSLNRRWLLVGNPSQFNQFYLYDLSNPSSNPIIDTIPSSIITPAKNSQSWKLVQWSSDNQHVVLEHLFDNQTEYILVDTQNPTLSINLTKTFSNISFDKLVMINNDYNSYYLYNSSTQELQSVNLATPQVINMTLSNVLAFKGYSTNVILFVTNDTSKSGKVLAEEQVGSKIYIIKSLNSATQYLLNLTTYNSIPYVVIGENNSDKIFIYQDPISQLNNDPNSAPGPIQVLLVPNPDYVSFSANAQFVMAENMNHFAVYNIQSGYAYSYDVKNPLDIPQTHATWMDGDRLMYVSSGKLVVFDYDDANFRILSKASGLLSAFFNQNYSDIYSIIPNSTNTNSYLTATSLVAK